MGFPSLSCHILADLGLLKTLEAQQLSSICQSCVEMLTGREEPKLRRTLSKSASTYGWNTGQLERALLGLTKLFVESSKTHASDSDLRVSVMSLSFDKDKLDIMANSYMHHKDAIGKVVKSVSAPLRIARYAKLEWRLDLQIESRFNVQPCNATLLFQLHLVQRCNSDTSFVCQVDYTNLQLMEKKLDDALRTLSSSHCDRLGRYIA